MRKLALTAHVVTSVGWLGAVMAFLALAIVGLTSERIQIVRAGYLAMPLIAWLVIVPLSFASLLSGIALSLGTTWGLFQHYWVVVKLLITVFAILVLLLHTGGIESAAQLAFKTNFSIQDLGGLRVQLTGEASAALFVLVVATILSVYKPAGLTGYGRRWA